MARTGQPVIYLDTHIVCWLYEGRIEKISEKAADTIENGDLFVSPVTDLELEYLYETGRIAENSDTILSVLAKDIYLQISNTPFSVIVRKAKTLNWTRDPFDRLISAEVMVTENALLVTKDRIIRKYCERAVW